MTKIYKRSVVVSIVIATLAACQTMTNPEKARVIAAPTTPVVKNMTSFSNSLRCMDDLFLAYGKRDIAITSDGVPDETGQVTLGSKEIMITTISKMATKSKAFKFVDIENNGDAVFWIQQNWAGVSQVQVPDYYIRGSITQADQGVVSDNQGGGVAMPFLSLGYSQDQMLALVSIDMNMGNVRTRQITPGLHTSNTITIVRSGKGGDAEGIIGKGSIFLEISQDRSQGSHQAVRTLIELSLIEVLGKFTKVPYWRCLEIDATDPNILAQTRDWFDQLSPDERIRVTQSALRSTQDYNGPVDGVLSRDLRNSVNRYKSRTDLIANGRIDFDLYFSFLTRNVAASPNAGGKGLAPQMVSASSSEPTGSNDLGFDPVGLKVRPVGTKGAISVNEDIRFQITVHKPADVYCYYEAVGEKPVRVFPSRFQSSARVVPGQQALVPPSDAPFAIRPSRNGSEQIACIATTAPYTTATRPQILDEGDLTPLSTDHMFQIINAHQQADDANSSIQHITFKVRPGGVS